MSIDEYTPVTLTGPENYLRWESYIDHSLSQNYDEDLFEHVLYDYAYLREQVDADHGQAAWQVEQNRPPMTARDRDDLRRARGALWWARKNAFKLIVDSISPDLRYRLPFYIHPARQKDPDPKRLYDYLKVTYGPRAHMAPVVKALEEVYALRIEEGEDPAGKMEEIQSKMAGIYDKVKHHTLQEFFRSVEFRALARALPPSYAALVEEHARIGWSTQNSVIGGMIAEHRRREKEGMVVNEAGKLVRRPEAVKEEVEVKTEQDV